MHLSNTRFIRTRARIAALAALVLVFSLLAGVACDNSNATTKTTYRLADAGWDSIQFHNAAVSVILEHGYDILTEEVSGSTPITWQALTTGDLQIYMEVWSENIPAYQPDIDAGKAIELGVNFDDNAQGFYVPRYVVEGDPERGIEPLAPGLKTVQDLPEYADVFTDPEDSSKGRIYGAIPGWAIDEIMFKKYEAYGLDETFNYFRPGSDAGLAASLVSAYDKGDAWVGYYWDPTWITGKLDLVLLGDTPFTNMEDFENGLNECPANRVTIAIHPSVQEENPAVAEMLSRYQTSSALTAEALAYMNDNDATAKEAAIWFLREHADLLETWVGDADRLADIQEALQAE